MSIETGLASRAKGFLVKGLVIAAMVGLSSVGASATDRASAPEAEAMVKKAVTFFKTNGAAKAYTEFSSPTTPFKDRDLYIVAYDASGTCLAHGANAKLIGKDLSDSEDADGKPFVQERMKLTKVGVPFWQDYKFSDPLTKRVEPKRMYCEPQGDVAICGGIYKP